VLTVSGFRGLRDKALDRWIRDNGKSDLPKYKGEFSKLVVGADFSKGK
jgi:hypothetical protein